MIVEIMIATIDSGLARVDQVLLAPQGNIRYLISHQITGDQYRVIPKSLVRDDIRLSQIEGRGLCRNRNNCLSKASGDIVVLADDDVRYRPENIKNLIETFAADPFLDVGCFKISTPPGEPEYKGYSTKSYTLNEESCHYLSTIEIAFRLESVMEKGLCFDERFGLGSRLNSFGEESVFIHDCLKAGLKVKFIPEYLVEHKAASTIKSSSRFDRVNNVFKGAYDARRYGWLAVPAAGYDTLRYWPLLKKENKSPLTYVAERIEGVCYIFKSGGKKNPSAVARDK